MAHRLLLLLFAWTLLVGRSCTQSPVVPEGPFDELEGLECDGAIYGAPISIAKVGEAMEAMERGDEVVEFQNYDSRRPHYVPQRYMSSRSAGKEPRVFIAIEPRVPFDPTKPSTRTSYTFTPNQLRNSVARVARTCGGIGGYSTVGWSEILPAIFGSPDPLRQLPPRSFLDYLVVTVSTLPSDFDGIKRQSTVSLSCRVAEKVSPNFRLTVSRWQLSMYLINNAMSTQPSRPGNPYGMTYNVDPPAIKSLSSTCDATRYGAPSCDAFLSQNRTDEIISLQPHRPYEEGDAQCNIKLTSRLSPITTTFGSIVPYIQQLISQCDGSSHTHAGGIAFLPDPPTLPEQFCPSTNPNPNLPVYTSAGLTRRPRRGNGIRITVSGGT